MKKPSTSELKGIEFDTLPRFYYWFDPETLRHDILLEVRPETAAMDSLAYSIELIGKELLPRHIECVARSFRHAASMDGFTFPLDVLEAAFKATLLEFEQKQNLVLPN